jgi:hypothetical protein
MEAGMVILWFPTGPLGLQMPFPGFGSGELKPSRAVQLICLFAVSLQFITEISLTVMLVGVQIKTVSMFSFAESFSMNRKGPKVVPRA